mgnify:CR=1
MNRKNCLILNFVFVSIISLLLIRDASDFYLYSLMQKTAIQSLKNYLYTWVHRS